MVKKLSLNIDYTSEFSFIGISCHLRDYRLSFFINQECGLKLRKIDDFVQEAEQNQSFSYPFFYYRCPDTNNNFCLLSNHHAEKKLIQAFKQFDYFLLVQNNLSTSNKKDLISNLKKIPNLLAAYEIELSKVKNSNQLLIDLELQLIENLKPYAQKKPQ